MAYLADNMFTMIFSQVVLTWGPLYSPFFSLWLRACHKTVPRQNRKNFPEIPTIQNRFVLYFYILVSILVLSNLKTADLVKVLLQLPRSAIENHI